MFKVGAPASCRLMAVFEQAKTEEQRSPFGSRFAGAADLRSA
jgi:hypothetical protein